MPEKFFELSVLGWASHAPGLERPEDWQHWSATGQIPAAAPSTPELPQIPAMLRRRLSPMGKSALWCCYQVLDEDENALATVFCSQHGEVAETVKLLKELALGQPLSPTAFSLSVHNATAGIHSIARGVTENITALAAGPDSCCAAILEAYTLIQQTGSAHERVLCVLYDSPLPNDYTASEHPPAFQASLALLVGRADAEAADLSLQFSLNRNTSGARSRQPLPDFIRMLIDASTRDASLDICCDWRHWRWLARKRHQ